MPKDEFAEALASLLRCVRDDCGSPLSGGDGGTGLDLECASCGARYRERDGVLDLAPEARNSSRSLAQRLMDSQAVAAIYETVFWRRSHTWLSGVGLEREMDVVLGWLSPLPGAPILDLACGPGLYARRLARDAPRSLVVGVDLSQAMLHRAALLARRERLMNLKLVRADLCRLPFATAGFARAHAAGVLHLLPEPGAALAEASRVLIEGGTFTAMTVRGATGPIGWLQRHANRQGTGSFLSAEQYRALCESARLAHFECRSLGLMLLFRAVRTGPVRRERAG
jgi:ubiquinone/menaquinone biosynthesis C-methylase UbiE